jgi:hypothetical protein
VNLLFLGVLLGTGPAKGFTALSTRGDWMLDGRHGATAESIRKQLFHAADRLEWLYLVKLFSSPVELGTFDYIGQIEANSGG